MANFTQFEQKKTHISGCKIVHLCTIATVTVHICMVTVTYAFNILLIFSLSYICSHSHSHLTLSSSLLSPHLTPPFSHLLSLSPLPLVKPCLHCHRFWALSPFRWFSFSTSGFWDSSRNPLKWHDNVMNDVMNECFTDQPLQPQQERINLRNPLKWRGNERVLRRS